MGFLTIVIYIILSLLVGVLLIGTSWDPTVLKIAVSYLDEVYFSDYWLRVVTALLGILLILMCLRYLQRILQCLRRDKSLTFESEQGKVSITLFAIEDMLKKALETSPEVSHVKVRVFLRKKFMEVMFKGVLVAEVNLAEFTKVIQETTKRKLHTLLGENKEVQVNLEIRKVAIGSKKDLIEKPEPEIPFRNYE